MKSSTGTESSMGNENSGWIEAILLLKNRKECEAFFEDLYSVEELNNTAICYAIAEMLMRGATYREVNSGLKVANATISRV